MSQGDYQGMTCDRARQVISALLDDEAPEPDRAALEAHLLACSDCADWQRRAHELTRRARLQPSPAPRPAPELRQTVLRAHATARPRWRSLTAPRVALAAVALAQLALTIPCLVLGHDHSAPVHVAHEMGSFDAAVAIGFLVAVRRPARAMGMLALIGVAALLLVATAAVDLLAGHTDVLDEAPHLLVVAGWMLLRRLAVLAPPSSDRPRALRQWGETLAAGLTPRLAPRTGPSAAGVELPDETVWPSTGAATAAEEHGPTRSVASG